MEIDDWWKSSQFRSVFQFRPSSICWRLWCWDTTVVWLCNGDDIVVDPIIPVGVIQEKPSIGTNNLVGWTLTMGRGDQAGIMGNIQDAKLPVEVHRHIIDVWMPNWYDGCAIPCRLNGEYSLKYRSISNTAVSKYAIGQVIYRRWIRVWWNDLVTWDVLDGYVRRYR